MTKSSSRLLTTLTWLTLMIGVPAFGQTTVVGKDADNSSPTGNPIPVAGSDGNTLQWLRTSSAVNLTAFPSLGVLLAEKGSRWTIAASQAAGAISSASRPAGGPGVRHVVDCITFSAASSTAPLPSVVYLSIRDGASGTGGYLWMYVLAIPGTVGQSIPPHTACGLNLIGSANTAITAEFNAGVINVYESVSMTGYDVQ